MNNDEMKQSLTELIMDNKELIELTEITNDEIMETVDKHLNEQEYEEMNRLAWQEYYLLENEIEVLKNLTELNTSLLNEKKRKQKMTSIIISLNRTVQYDIIENLTNTINNL